MPNSPRLKWPYPAENKDPWYEDFESLIQAQDASGYASREDRHLILAEGGVVSWNATTNTLEWGSALRISSPITGRLLTVAAGSVLLEEGSLLYATLVRAPGTNATLQVSKASQVPSSDTALILAIRISSRIYWRNGVMLNDGDSITNIGAGQGGGGGGTDPNAIHDNVASEIAVVPAKAIPTGTDYLLIEDAADSLNKKSIQIADLPATTDADAIHDNVAGEIAAVAAKATPVSGDYILIEDSADSNNKKSITVGDLPTTDADAIHDNVAGEIAAVAAKAVPTSSDYILIEDAADSNNKKSITIGNIPGLSTDKRTAAIVVGNSVNGDTSSDCDYLDIGDGAQLAAAITAAGPGADVYIRPGTYDFSLPLGPSVRVTIPANVRVRGAGPQHTIIKSNLSGDCTIFELSDGCILEDIFLEAQEPTGAQTTGYGVVEAYGVGDSVECHRLWVDFTGGWSTVSDGDIFLASAIDTYDIACGRFFDCVVTNIPQPGVPAGDMYGYSLFGEEIMARGLRSDGGDFGIVLGGTSSTRVTQCVCTGFEQAGISVFNASEGVIISDSRIEELLTASVLGFRVFSPATGTAVTLANNYVRLEGSNVTGIQLSSMNQCTVSGNMLRTAGGQGGAAIVCIDADYNVISGNRGDGNWTAFVTLDSGSGSNVVTGNNGAGSSFTDNGTGNDLAHNL